LIAHLRGRVLSKQPQELCLDVGGVGYRVLIPLSTFYRLPEPGVEAAVHVHTHVREDALALFGFLTRGEQDIFERLIGVSGVGPRVALAILSGIEAPELVAALGAGDVARLTRIPGVGKKTAERLVLELRDKMPALVALPAADAAPPRAIALQDDVLSALANLGYARALAERAVERAARERPEARFEDLLRLALRSLAGG
jgi:Holliday junction DNA helicase RuvA